MAKVAKPKRRETSIHSRAHRRNATPPPATARSKSGATEQNEQWMYNAQSAGVSKKSKAKKLTHAQRVRQSKAIERAERNMDVLEKKVAESKQREKKVQARRKAWDELNDTAERGDTVVANPTLEDGDSEVDMNDPETAPQVHAEDDHLADLQVSHELEVSADHTEGKPASADDLDIIT